MADEYRVAPPEPETCRVVKRIPVEHPPWCDPDLCNVDEKGHGTHNSKVLMLRARQPSPLGIGLTLIQSEPTPGYPSSGNEMVTMTFVDTDDGFDFGTIPMDMDTAARLGWVLVSGPEAIAVCAGVDPSGLIRPRSRGASACASRG
jgi:hypothetical protein